MRTATRFRDENIAIATKAGWRVISVNGNDQFMRGDVTIEVALSPKDFIRNIIKYGPRGEVLAVKHKTVGKVDLLRLWLTGQPSNVISLSIKQAAGVNW